MMPKSKKVAVKSVAKSKKQKLSPAERSQVAKDRWAKRRGGVAPQDAVQGVDTSTANESPVVVTLPTPENFTITTDVPVVATSVVTVTTPASQPPIDEFPLQPIHPAPAPQFTPVAPKKQKRYTGPKEFSVALKAAEGRLAKAIVERAQAAGQLAALQAEIPSLLQIIAALKGQHNIPAASYDLSAQFPNPVAPQYRPQPYVDPLAAIQGAAAQPPVSRATGNAIQFGPDVMGALEDPEDDEDQFLKGPAAGSKGWI